MEDRTKATTYFIIHICTDVFFFIFTFAMILNNWNGPMTTLGYVHFFLRDCSICARIAALIFWKCYPIWTLHVPFRECEEHVDDDDGSGGDETCCNVIVCIFQGIYLLMVLYVYLVGLLSYFVLGFTAFILMCTEANHASECPVQYTLLFIIMLETICSIIVIKFIQNVSSFDNWKEVRTSRRVITTNQVRRNPTPPVNSFGLRPNANQVAPVPQLFAPDNDGQDWNRILAKAMAMSKNNETTTGLNSNGMDGVYRNGDNEDGRGI